MTINLFSVRDIKSGFACPFTAANSNVAQRIFAGCVNSRGNVIHDYPEDFQLWAVGDFETNNGVLVPDISGVPKFICDAVSLVSKDIEEVSIDEEKV